LEKIVAKKLETLHDLFDGWPGHNQSLLNAIAPLTSEQLSWRPKEGFRSVGEVARHISLSRLGWFLRMNAPGSTPLADRIPKWETDRDGVKDIVEESVDIAGNADSLVEWLTATWDMIDQTLTTWSLNDLARAYTHQWNGESWANSRHWTIWRILTHDIHHGGELSLMLGLQGIEAFELSGLFGHLVLPDKAGDQGA
jgi:uncharacterized damage-inducible protein DinB